MDPLGQAGTRIAVRASAARQPPRFYDALLRALSELGEGVVLMEDEFFVFANEAFARMVGRQADELTRGKFSVRRLIAPEAREAMEARLLQRLSGEIPEEHYETTLLHADGARVHVEISVKPLRDAKSLRFAVLRDVTARKRAEEEVLRMRLEIAKSEKLSAMGSLVGGVAHEVRTPLVVVENHAHLLEMRLRRAKGTMLDEQHERDFAAHLAGIHDGVERVSALVRDLNRFARRPLEQTEPAPLETIVAEAARLWTSTHLGGSTELVLDLDPTPLVLLDKGKVQQVVLNLLQNASEAMPQGGRIFLVTSAGAAEAHLIVRDEGVGIATDEQGRIFEPLYTTKPEGMGLGLDIVRRIVEQHHGSIRVESAPGSGTTFHVTFPAA